MGCSSSTSSSSDRPQEPDARPVSLVSQDEMQAVKERLKQAQIAAAEEGAKPEKKNSSFRRKFNGYKGVAAGGPKHTVRRASDRSAEGMAELASINALIKQRKSEQAAAKKAELNDVPRPRSKSPAGMRAPGGSFRSPSFKTPSFKRVKGSFKKSLELSRSFLRMHRGSASNASRDADTLFVDQNMNARADVATSVFSLIATSSSPTGQRAGASPMAKRSVAFRRPSKEQLGEPPLEIVPAEHAALPMSQMGA